MEDRFKFRARWKDTLEVITDFIEQYTIEALNGDTFIVEQCTGLRVHNKPLYEGDIFTTPDYPFYSDNELNYVGVVVYEDHKDYLGWYYEMHVVSDRVRGGACGSALTDVAHADIKIIGNIHENPELLEK